MLSRRTTLVHLPCLLEYLIFFHIFSDSCGSCEAISFSPSSNRARGDFPSSFPPSIPQLVLIRLKLRGRRPLFSTEEGAPRWPSPASPPVEVAVAGWTRFFGGGGGGGGGLHAEQHFEYHRHLKPGDVLTGTNKPGKTWEKEGKRSGKLVFSETVTEYRDQNGELVITATGVGVRTERPVDQ